MLLFSAAIGIVITYAPYKKISFPLFSANLIDSFVAGVLANIPTLFGLTVQPDKIIVGTIMLLVPGLTVVNAMRDLMNGDLVAGLFELFNSIISALGIGTGCCRFHTDFYKNMILEILYCIIGTHCICNYYESS